MKDKGYIHDLDLYKDEVKTVIQTSTEPYVKLILPIINLTPHR